MTMAATQTRLDPKLALGENAEFPVVCETCLGDNPYVRMAKQPLAKECEVCTRPFTTFRWKAGTNGRYKKTVICQVCSKLKNVCQCCVLDLNYGLPVQVRDTVLERPGGPNDLPISHVNREYFAQQAEKTLATMDGPAYGKISHETIVKLNRMGPYYARNRARVCSFFVKGECTRGKECPFRHEMPDLGPLSKQNTKDRFYGVNDPVAHKLLTRLDVANEKQGLTPPDDPDIRTLYIGGLAPATDETKLRSIFYQYGEIESIYLMPRASCAFITYALRAGAEKASSSLGGFVECDERRVKISWAKGRKSAISNDAEDSLQAPLSTPSNSQMSYELPLPPGVAIGVDGADAPKPAYPSASPHMFGGSTHPIKSAR
jgi:pre-mRNA-splicing factor RBM22/SLT11